MENEFKETEQIRPITEYKVKQVNDKGISVIESKYTFLQGSVLERFIKNCEEHFSHIEKTYSKSKGKSKDTRDIKRKSLKGL